MERQLKLNYKRTLIIGFAFFSILMVWQAYNFYCPLYLRTLLEPILKKNNAINYTDFIIGVIMALDNVVALFMLPIFGSISDKTKSRFGKRMPYILIGMLLTLIIFPFIAVSYIFNSLLGVILTMLAVLLIMNVYRSPAVALMPDVTPKPLRSSANGLINLVGYFGPILITVVNMVPFFSFTLGENNKLKILVPVIVVALSLIIAILVLFFKIKENKIIEETKQDLLYGEKLSTTLEEVKDDTPLSKKDKKNMILLLIAVCLWFMSFNAVETFNSTYFDIYYSKYEEVQITDISQIDDDQTYYIYVDDQYKSVENDQIDIINNNYYIKSYIGSKIASMATIILTVSSVLTFIVAGLLAQKFGRKYNTIAGIILLIIGFTTLNFISGTGFIIYIMFFLVGVGWALINVNSYPMMVEMSSSKNIGKYTGLYYTSSMIAQSVTPILLGAIIAFVPDVSLRNLFLYSAIMALLAVLVIIFFKENKNKIKDVKTGLSAFDQD